MKGNKNSRPSYWSSKFYNVLKRECDEAANIHKGGGIS